MLLFFVGFFIDKTEELAASGHITAFTDVDETHFGRQRQTFKSGKPEHRLTGHSIEGARRHVADFTGNGCNVLGCGTATSADDIHQTFLVRHSDGS